jgi:transposase-like protein
VAEIDPSGGDALMIKRREGGRVANVAGLVATGVNDEGRREILGLDVVTVEDGAGWLAILSGLKARGSKTSHPGPEGLNIVPCSAAW